MLSSLSRRPDDEERFAASSSAEAAAAAGRVEFEEEIHGRIEGDLAEFGELVEITGGIVHTKRHGIMFEDLTAVLKHPHLRLPMQVGIGWNPNTGKLTYTNELGREVRLRPEKWLPSDLPTFEDLKLIDEVMERVEIHPVWSSLEKNTSQRVPDTRTSYVAPRPKKPMVLEGEVITPESLPRQPLTSSTLGGMILNAPVSFYVAFAAMIPIGTDLFIWNIDSVDVSTPVLAGFFGAAGCAVHEGVQKWKRRAVEGGRAPMALEINSPEQNKNSSWLGRSMAPSDKLLIAGALRPRAQTAEQEKSLRENMFLKGTNHLVEQWNLDLKSSFRSLFDSSAEQEEFLDAFLTMCAAKNITYSGDLSVCPAPVRATADEDPHATEAVPEGRDEKMPYHSNEMNKIGTALLSFKGATPGDYNHDKQMFFDGRRFYRAWLSEPLCPIA